MMGALLLLTKLYLPQPRSDLVPRPRLLARLNQGLSGRLILISGPAGFGKTTLLSEWLAGASYPAAWLSLDAGDNDPARFFNYVIAALRTLAPGVGEGAEKMLLALQPPPLESVLTALLNDLCALPGQAILVLDDYHVIEQPAIHKAIAFLLDRLPPQIHLVIATRADPPLPLSRLRARGQMTEVRADDLRFTPDEATVFLNRVMGLDLAAEDVIALEARTEGWIVGLQMAALSMQGRRDVAGFIRSFGGSHRYILDYLVDEVLDRQPDAVQAFLLQTSILGRLSGPLCDAVVEFGEKANQRPASGQETLEALEHANLFIVPLDDERRWYRYHLLFADLLRARLQQVRPDLLIPLHRRAAEWFERHHLWIEAVNHVLAAQDFEWAARLVEHSASVMQTHGEVTSLMNWIGRLPVDLVRRRPLLCVIQAWALAFAWESLEDIEPLLQAAERQLPQDAVDPATRYVMGHIATIRAFVADRGWDVFRARHYAQLADTLLPEDEVGIRALIPYMLGRAYRLEGDLARARSTFVEMLQLGEVAGNDLTIALAQVELATLCKLQGQLCRAVDLYQEALRPYLLNHRRVESSAESRSSRREFLCLCLSQTRQRRYQTTWPGGGPFDPADEGVDDVIITVVSVGLGDLLYEYNNLEAAEKCAQRALDQINPRQLWATPVDLISAYTLRARVQQARGDPQGALDTLQSAEQLWRNCGVYSHVSSTVAACRVKLWLAQGRVAEAAGWAQESLPGEEEGALARELEQITLARVRIAQGDPEGALRLLARPAEAAESGGRTGRLIEILLLQALAFQAQNDAAQALAVLERCLALAEPEGYVRLFVDEGRPMAALLRQAAARGAAPAYADRLLATFGGWEDERVEERPPRPHTPPLIEPLSERELEVLQLLVAGLSNRKIAEKLYLAVGTVKTHIHNIYGKLGVDNRAQAVAKAIELGL